MSESVLFFAQARDLETFYDQYIGNPNSSIQDNQCIVFANVKSKAAMSRKPKLGLNGFND